MHATICTTPSVVPLIVILPFSQQILAIVDVPLTFTSVFVAVTSEPCAKGDKIIAAYPSASVWEFDVIVEPSIVTVVFSAATFITFKPVKSESLIATTAFGAELATFTV